MVVEFAPVPSRHKPVVAFALLGVNLLVTLLVMTQGQYLFDKYSISYESGIQPMLWLTSPFVHFDMVQLAGNLIFLVAFALMIEGRIGPAPFLGLFLVIAVGGTAIDQALMGEKPRVAVLDDTEINAINAKPEKTAEDNRIIAKYNEDVVRLAKNRWHIPIGASAAIFGLIAVFLIIGPDTKMELGEGGSMKIPLIALAVLFVVWEGAKWSVTGFQAGILPTQLSGIIPGVICGFLFKGMASSAGDSSVTSDNKKSPEVKKVMTAAQRKQQTERLRKSRAEAAEKLEQLRLQYSHLQTAAPAVSEASRKVIEETQTAIKEKKFPRAVELILGMEEPAHLSEISLEIYEKLGRYVMKENDALMAAAILEKSIAAHSEDDAARRMQLAKIFLDQKNEPKSRSTLAKIDRKSLTREQLRLFQHLVIELRQLE